MCAALSEGAGGPANTAIDQPIIHQRYLVARNTPGKLVEVGRHDRMPPFAEDA